MATIAYSTFKQVKKVASFVTNSNASRIIDKPLNDTPSLNSDGFQIEENPLRFANLQFPSDLGEQSGQGHYIIFYTVENKHSAELNKKFNKSLNIKMDELTLKNDEGDAGESVVDTGQKLGIYSLSRLKKRRGETIDQAFASNLKVKAKAAPNSFLNVKQEKLEDGNTYGSGALSTHTNITSAVAMYMPAGVKVTYSVENGPSELGMAALAGGTINKALSSDNVKDGVSAALKGLSNFAVDAARKFVISAGEEAGLGDIEGVLTKVKGMALNNFSETVFEKVNHRSFSYDFQMTAKSQREVENIHKIIKVFKYHMHPELNDPDTITGIRYFKVPSEFEIHYAYNEQENNYLNKISRCVLTDMDVDYGDGGEFQSFRQFDDNGASPVTIKMSLQFTETTPLTKAEIMEGY